MYRNYPNTIPHLNEKAHKTCIFLVWQGIVRTAQCCAMLFRKIVLPAQGCEVPHNT